MKIISKAFENGENIPPKYTCQGQEINPPLSFLDIPKTAKSLTLIMHDPDVPKSLRADGNWDHWILFNIDPKITEIKENSVPICNFGITTSNTLTYVGPCPPDKQHRYFFTLYALDITLKSPQKPTRKMVENAMQGHILSKAELIGLYEKTHS